MHLGFVENLTQDFFKKFLGTLLGETQWFIHLPELATNFIKNCSCEVVSETTHNHDAVNDGH